MVVPAVKRVLLVPFKIRCQSNADITEFSCSSLTLLIISFIQIMIKKKSKKK